MILLPQASLTDTIAAILDRPALKSSISGVHVRAADGRELAAINADRRYMPASNQKALTCMYALWAAGPEWRPTTRFWKRGSMLHIASEGDPGMTYAQLKDVRKALGASQVVRLQQDYKVGWPEDWEWDDLGNRYAAPVAAFTFDQGAFELWNVNGKARYRPEAFGAKIESGPRLSYDPFTQTATVPKLEKKTERLDTLALAKPDQAAASIFARRVEFTTSVPSWTPTRVVTGGSIQELVEKCLPPSDNLIAENLFLMATGRRVATRPMTYAIARKEMTTFLTDVVGLPASEVNVRDGSGLSRRNLVSPRAMTQALRWGLAQPWGPAYRAAMASPEKGTLRRRLQGVRFEGKTGSLTMVVGLSGYLRTKKGDDVTISILLNHYPGTADEARAIADDIVRAVDAS